MIFAIDTDNVITAHDAAPTAQDGLILFATEREFTRATAEWPINRLVEVWNSFAGVAPFDDLKPVRKFENHEIATRRIWQAIQRMRPDAAPTAKVSIEAPAETAALAAPKTKGKKTAKAAKVAKPPKPARTPKAAKAPKAPGEPKTAREGTHKAAVIEMLKRKSGATLDEIIKLTGWQKHTIRAFVSTLPKKTGLVITSTRRDSDKARVYAAR